MATTDYRVIEHPGAWKASDFEGKDDLAIELEPRHVAALEAALAGVHDAGIALDMHLGIGHRDVMASMERFAARVMPQFKDKPRLVGAG